MNMICLNRTGTGKDSRTLTDSDFSDTRAEGLKRVKNEGIMQLLSVEDGLILSPGAEFYKNS